MIRAIRIATQSRSRRAFVRLGAAFAAVVTVILAMASPASATTEGSWLYRDPQTPDIIYNLNSLDLGGRQLIMQNDGNLVMYNNSVNPRIVCWASNTNGEGGGSSYAILQSDSNFVVYPYVGGPAIWASSWFGWGGNTVHLGYHGDGRVDFYIGSNLIRTC